MMHPPMTRRAAVTLITGAAAASLAPMDSPVAASEQSRRTGMGLVIYDCNIRRRWMRKQQPSIDLFEPLTFLQHCRSLGAGGMQASLGVLEPHRVEQLSTYAAEHDLFIDAIIKPPTGSDDIGRFESEIQTARDVGVQAARTTIIPGRRYERFQTLSEFREFESRGREMLERAVPVLEKHRVKFAVENHKDQRLDERVALFEHLSCEYVGACVDTGNSFALLDGAYEPIEALAPYAFTVHLKDQALQPFSDGFLLADIPLGEGSFNLKRMVNVIQKAKPDIRFALELITRDPLKVPCLTDGFFATMPNANAADLARTLRFVRDNSVDTLQQVSTVSVEKQVALEDANVRRSIAYAGSQLGI